MDPGQQGFEISDHEQGFPHAEVLPHVDQPLGHRSGEGCDHGGVGQVQPRQALLGLGRGQITFRRLVFLVGGQLLFAHLSEPIKPGFEVDRGRLGLLQPEPVFIIVDAQQRIPLGHHVAFLGDQFADHARGTSQDLGFLVGFEGRGGVVETGDRPGFRSGDRHRDGLLIGPAAGMFILPLGLLPTVGLSLPALGLLLPPLGRGIVLAAALGGH